jgi:hypothetical protein
MRTHRKRNRWLWAAAGATSLLLACGGQGAGELVGPAGQGPSDDGGADAQPADATTSSDDGPVFVFEAGAQAPTSFKCQPGTYRGCFDTKVAGFTTWNGALSITLVASDAGTTANCGGEGFDCTTSLTIAPGAQLAGQDAYGGSFAMNLSGALDCSPDAGPATLSGTLNGGYCYFATSCDPDAGLHIGGALTAIYGNSPPTLAGLNSVVDGGLSVCAITGDSGCVFAGAMGGNGWEAWLDAGTPDCGGF